MSFLSKGMTAGYGDGQSSLYERPAAERVVVRNVHLEL